jgi:hypothetical protein
MRWRNVLTVAILLAALVGGVAWVAGRSQIPVNPQKALRAHDIPMDYADEDVREAVEMFKIEHKTRVEVEPILGTCDASKEVYRVETIPGLGGEPGFRVTDLTISGNTARVIRREFKIDPAPAAWREVTNTIVTSKSADRIRDTAVRLLEAKIPVSDGFPPPDAGEWIVEMCWHGRYHFFQRSVPQFPRDEGFAKFASELRDLR